MDNNREDFHEELLVVDAKLTNRDETLTVIETLTLQLVEALAKGADPTLLLVYIYYYNAFCVFSG